MIRRGSAIRLEGKKVVLREKRLSDARTDYAWATDEELSRLDAASPMKLSFEQAAVLYEEELTFPSPRRVRFAIESQDGQHIGNCMIYDVNEGRAEAELGIMIGDRRYWGQSYGTDAVRTLVRYVFTQTRLRRLYLHTLDWNARAQRSFEKAGFVSKARISRNGYNFIAMELLKADWEKAQSAEGAGARLSP